MPSFAGFLLNSAKAAYGEELNEGQELLAYIADIMIDIYALESALLRTEKLIASRGIEAGLIAVDIVRVYACDAANRVEHFAKQIKTSLADNNKNAFTSSKDFTVRFYQSANTIAARRRIADSIIRQGQYHL